MTMMVVLLILSSNVSKRIPASGTLAKAGARYSPLKALAVFLLTLTGFALAALEVHVFILIDLILECVNISFKNVLHSLSSFTHKS